MSGSSTWRPTGSWTGGSVAALALSPHFTQDQLILAATAAGLYRSADGGHRWARAHQGLSDPRITTVAFAPSAQLAWAATADGRLFQTLNGGDEWQELRAWAGLGVISVITFSPHFAQDQTVFVATPEGIFRSQEGGRAWESSTFGLLDLEILCLACAPNFAETELVWAGSALGGLYRSRNSARSWRDAGQGLPDMAIQCMVASPHFAQDQTIWVGTESDGLYCSTDGGTTWQAGSTDLAGQSINALVSSEDGQTLLAGTGTGIYRSTNGGQRWHLSTDELLALTLAIAPDGTSFAGSYQTGVFQLPPAADRWVATIDGLAARVPPLALGDPASTLYLLDVEGALAASPDQGATWQPLNPAVGDEAVWAATLATGTPDASRLYAATAQALSVAHGVPLSGGWQTHPLPEGAATPVLLTVSSIPAAAPVLLLADEAGNLYESASDGAHWQQLAAPWSTQHHLLALLISPLDRTNQTRYGLTAQVDSAKGYLIQLWQTTNKGSDWQVLVDFYTDTPAATITLPLDPVEQPILVGVRNRLIKVYKPEYSIAWAADQAYLAHGLRITNLVTTERYVEDRTLYVTTNDGVWQTQDNGTTWQPVGSGLAGQTIVAFWPSTPARPATALALGGGLWQLVGE